MWYYWTTVYTDWLAMKVVIIVNMQEQYQFMFTDTIACIDKSFNLIPDKSIYLFILSSTWAISVFITIYLGISHFRKVRRIKKQKKSYEEL